jgi:hypothetical protein
LLSYLQSLARCIPAVGKEPVWQEIVKKVVKDKKKKFSKGPERKGLFEWSDSYAHYDLVN